MRNKFNPYLQIIGFALVAIVLVLDLISILSVDRGYSATENRNLELRPELTLNTFMSGRYEEKYEDYTEDQFPFRNLWIRVKTTSDRLVGKNESNGVYLCKSGYLIQNFNDPKKENISETYAAIADFSERHSDLNQYAIIAPTAVTVHSDKLPKNAPVDDQNAFIDEAATAFTAANVTFVDIRSHLEKAKENNQIYYKTDHHWTTHGAYAAYKAFADEAGLTGKNLKYNKLLVSNSFQGTLSASSGFRMSAEDKIFIYMPKNNPVDYIVSYEEENIKTSSAYHTDNLEIRDQYTVFLNGNHSLIEISTLSETRKSILVIKDSYANCFIPFLINDYSKIIVVDPRYYAGDIDIVIKTEQINDVLYLYNASTFAEDANLKAVIRTPESEKTEE
ncbi:MAG: hypothetical protein IKV45_01305 [Firmicutes bacterium]|nr:hypothetical protein [Bacillota bacterium]